ncbi:MAG: hypothetical protein LBS21_16285 [Clostridiales bacterium]|jgi:type VI protein secretion system component VasF|nr:hypothetical protein [Clostridiales bacterium]
MKKEKKHISATEIGQYVYCPHQFYYIRKYGYKELNKLSREARGEYNDETKSNFKRGLKHHAVFLRNYRIRAIARVAVWLLAAAGVLILLFLYFWLGI